MEYFSADDLLFSACREGDVQKAKTALDLGANVNALYKVGEFECVDDIPSGCKWKGKVYITPLIVAATSAFGKPDTKPYETLISMLLRNKKIDLEHVVFNEEDEYQHSVFGEYICINKNMSYSESLDSVLKTAVWGKKNGKAPSAMEESSENISFKRLADSFQISPKMADFIAKLNIVPKQKSAFLRKLFGRGGSSK